MPSGWAGLRIHELYWTGDNWPTLDPDACAVVIVESSGSTSVAEESTTSDTYTVVLDPQPTSSVTITIDPDVDTQVNSQGAGNTDTLTFTTANWDTAQTVTVTAIDDTEIERDPHTSTITHSASSIDNDYDSIMIDNVYASVADNHGAAVVVISEDFETPGSEQVTHYGTYLEDGYLKGDYPAHATLDGTYPAPIRIEMTFNMLGATGTWEGPGFGWASDNTGDGMWGMANGLAVGFFPNAYDGGLTLMTIESSGYVDIQSAYYLMPGFDVNAYNLLVVEEVGSTVNFWVEEVGNPANNTGVLSFDLSSLSGYTRFGDYAHIAQYSGGIEDVTIYIYSEFYRDGNINFDDFAMLAYDWKKPSGSYVADISGPAGLPDGVVDEYDLMQFFNDWLDDTAL